MLSLYWVTGLSQKDFFSSFSVVCGSKRVQNIAVLELSFIKISSLDELMISSSLPHARQTFNILQFFPVDLFFTSDWEDHEIFRDVSIIIFFLSNRMSFTESICGYFDSCCHCIIRGVENLLRVSRHNHNEFLGHFQSNYFIVIMTFLMKEIDCWRAEAAEVVKSFSATFLLIVINLSFLIGC